jgi:hypothetical protein
MGFTVLRHSVMSVARGPNSAFAIHTMLYSVQLCLMLASVSRYVILCYSLVWFATPATLSTEATGACAVGALLYYV